MNTDKNEFNIVHFKKGDTIFKEGEEGNCAYLIRSGVVKIYRMVNSTKLSISHLRAGQIMGEMAVISSTPRSASAEAAENCELVKIDRKSLDNALGKTLPVIKAMLDQLIHRFRLIDKQSTIKESDKILLTACSIIDSMRTHPNGLDYTALYQSMNEKFDLSEAIFENILNKLRDQELIKDIPAGNIRKILPCVPRASEGVITSIYTEDEFLNIDDFANMLKTTPKDVITRAGIGYIPINLFYISKDRAAVWAEDIGEDIFDHPYGDDD